MEAAKEEEEEEEEEEVKMFDDKRGIKRALMEKKF